MARHDAVLVASGWGEDIYDCRRCGRRDIIRKLPWPFGRCSERKK